MTVAEQTSERQSAKRLGRWGRSPRKRVQTERWACVSRFTALAV